MTAINTHTDLLAQGRLIPDLLHAEPGLHIDYETIDTALVFAFAGSTSGSLFADALQNYTLPSSTWDPAGFVEDLFLQDFVRSCFQVQLGNNFAALPIPHLVRLLSAAPSALETVNFRRTIVSELLDQPELRENLSKLYRALVRFRAHLEGASAADKWDPNRRQLEILARFAEVVEILSRDFASAQSGLSRLNEFGKRVAQGESFAALQDLLRYDENLATLRFQMSVGADGRIREMKLLSLEENEGNPFVVSPLRRWLAKFELFLRGFRFGDGEVMARLLDAVYEGVRAEFVALVQLCADVEFYLGALGFHQRATTAGLSLCLPDLDSAQSPREILGLFNPLLLGAGITPVPCDIQTDRHESTLLVTGPNSGGKTRLLQAIGLSQVLAQAGLFVPAKKARLALAPALVVSLIQEVRVDQTEGRLGMELLRIRSLFERLPPGAMVILDELCSGTNPSEGEEIFELVVRMLALLTPQAFITTHFLTFAARLQQQAKIPNLRFLQVVLGSDDRPTYQFASGVAQTSLAGQAAARLGVTGEQLLALIEKKVAQSNHGKG
ncbi:MAG TPA: DNA mismatch repair protein [Polyangiaceae bacterium]|nr:DNA mismatch repair protein [Polyangiaceae bacterium]